MNNFILRLSFKQKSLIFLSLALATLSVILVSGSQRAFADVATTTPLITAGEESGWETGPLAGNCGGSLGGGFTIDNFGALAPVDWIINVPAAAVTVPVTFEAQNYYCTRDNTAGQPNTVGVNINPGSVLDPAGESITTGSVDYGGTTPVVSGTTISVPVASLGAGCNNYSVTFTPFQTNNSGPAETGTVSIELCINQAPIGSVSLSCSGDQELFTANFSDPDGATYSDFTVSGSAASYGPSSGVQYALPGTLPESATLQVMDVIYDHTTDTLDDLGYVTVWSQGAIPPPDCDSAAPTATATADCRNVDFDNITAGDADFAGTPSVNYISWQLIVNGVAGPVNTTNSMPATIALPSPNDQLGTASLNITVQDLDFLGNIAVSQPTFHGTFTYGPCYTLTCGPSNVPATIVGDPSSPSTFPVSMNMIFKPVIGADAPIATESDTIDGLNSYTAGVMSDVLTGSGGYTEPPNSPQTSNFNGPIPATAGNLSDATNIYNTFTEPATIGNYNVTFTFTDPAVPADDISCPPAMLQVVDAPYLTVQGGDVTAGSVFKVLPDQCTPDVPSLGDGGGHVYDGVFAWNQGSGGNYVGSGTDLAVQAMGDIYGFTSQAANNQTTPNALTFANNNPKAQPNSFGNVYNYAPCPPKINTAGAVGPTVKVSDGNSPEILGAGATKKIIVNGNAYITANVTYLNNAANPWTKPSDIPSFELVVEGNIFISSNVTELDGTYMAEPNSAGNGGNIYDCATITAPGTAANPSNGMTGTFASTAKCNNPLTVVGSFIAPDIYLQRDYGSVFGQSGGIAPTPAENFIYTPETWLNGPNPSDGNYDSLTSLPPIL